MAASAAMPDQRRGVGLASRVFIRMLFPYVPAQIHSQRSHRRDPRRRRAAHLPPLSWAGARQQQHPTGAAGGREVGNGR